MSGHDSFLFNNKEILNGNLFFYNAWMEKGVVSVQDVMDKDESYCSSQFFRRDMVIYRFSQA